MHAAFNLYASTGVGCIVVAAILEQLYGHNHIGWYFGDRTVYTIMSSWIEEISKTVLAFCLVTLDIRYSRLPTSQGSQPIRVMITY